MIESQIQDGVEAVSFGCLAFRDRFVDRSVDLDPAIRRMAENMSFTDYCRDIE